MFKFKHVHAENFMSFHDLDLDLDNQGLVLLEGKNETNESFSSNASGKTTVLSTIPWCLFGRTPTNVSHDDVVNNITGKNTLVALDVEVDGVPHRIERYRKHSKHKNTVKLFREGEEITAKSVKDTDKQIQDLFKVDWNTFTTALFQGQGNTVTFANASDAEKKNILEGISGIAIYKKAQDIAKQKLGDTKVEENEILHKLQMAQQELTILEDRERSEQEAYAVTASMIERDTLAYDKAMADYMAIGYEQSLEIMVAHLASIPVLDQPEELPPSDEEVDIDYKLKETQYKLEEQDAATATIEEAIRGYLKDLQAKTSERATLATADTCRYCGAPLDNDHAMKESERLANEITALQESINMGKTYLATMINPVKAELTQQDMRLSAELSRLAKEREAKRWENYRTQTEERNNLSRAIAQTENERDMRLSGLKSLERNVESLKQVPQPKDRTEEKQTVLTKVEALQQELLATNVTKEQYEQTVSMFSNTGIRSVVLDLITPFLNERANKYSALLSGADIEILFSTQTKNKDGSYADKFGVSVINNHGGELYAANSGGEKKRIDLAISFAIQDLVMSKDDLQTNIALYDEIFESLDPIGCESVITLLQEKQKQIGSIFVITHNSALSTLFDNVITVKKENGVSKIAEK